MMLGPRVAANRLGSSRLTGKKPHRKGAKNAKILNPSVREYLDNVTFQENPAHRPRPRGRHAREDAGFEQM